MTEPVTSTSNQKKNSKSHGTVIKKRKKENTNTEISKRSKRSVGFILFSKSSVMRRWEQGAKP